MRASCTINVVSDVHGNAEAMARAGHADALVCLGDLISFVDYVDPGRGVLGSLFGADAVMHFVGLRNELRFDEARAFSHSLWGSLDEPPKVLMEREVRKQYSELFAAMADVVAGGTPVFLTHGNDDFPALFADYLVPGITVVDGSVVDVAGTTWGFVGGVLPSAALGVMVTDEVEYDRKLAGLAGHQGPALDVVASHIPPDMPWLVYDTIARRYERGSAGLLSLLDRVQPTWSVFGHVHNPLSAHAIVGRTRCANVGHFRVTGVPYVLHL